MSFSAVQEAYAGLAGRATAVYGLSPLLGRLWGVLLLSPAPLGLDALAAAVGAAKSTVSVSMRQLERYRLVERHWRKGDRRDYYAPRTDYLAILRDWYRLFGQPRAGLHDAGQRQCAPGPRAGSGGGGLATAGGASAAAGPAGEHGRAHRPCARVDCPIHRYGSSPRGGTGRGDSDRGAGMMSVNP